MKEQLVNVDLGDRAYPVRIVPGALSGLGKATAEVLRPSRCVIVSNPVVGALYAHAALEVMEAAGFGPALIYVPDGEESKTLETYARLVEDLVTVGVDRSTPIVSLGGGVTGDIAGFAASTVLRGVPLVQVPTTLLAMVDASVGGKTGVNTSHGKNLVGSFYQPRLVYAATHVLGTLDNAEWRCGLGESLKHGVIRDARFMEWMVEESGALHARRPETVARMIRRCCEIKAAVVAEDEREAGLRAILNFGHTVGHAVETALGHGVLRHGEAVALGMLVEARFAAQRNVLRDLDVPDIIQGALERLNLPTSVKLPPGTGVSTFQERLLHASRLDKKVTRGTLNWVIPEQIGEVLLYGLPREELPEMLELVPIEEEST